MRESVCPLLGNSLALVKNHDMHEVMRPSESRGIATTRESRKGVGKRVLTLS